MCKILGKDTTNPEEIVEFLRTVDVAKLIEVQGQIGQVEVCEDDSEEKILDARFINILILPYS